MRIANRTRSRSRGSFSGWTMHSPSHLDCHWTLCGVTDVESHPARNRRAEEDSFVQEIGLQQFECRKIARFPGKFFRNSATFTSPAGPAPTPAPAFRNSGSTHTDAPTPADTSAP